ESMAGEPNAPQTARSSVGPSKPSPKKKPSPRFAGGHGAGAARHASPVPAPSAAARSWFGARGEIASGSGPPAPAPCPRSAPPPTTRPPSPTGASSFARTWNAVLDHARRQRVSRHAEPLRGQLLIGARRRERVEDALPLALGGRRQRRRRNEAQMLRADDASV